MSRQTQNSMLLVGSIAGGVGFTAFVALMVIGEFVFSAALFLAILVAAGVAIFLFRAFHTPVDAPVSAMPEPVAAPTATPAPELEPAPAPAPEPEPEPEPAPTAAPAPAPEPAPEPAPMAVDGPARLEAAREGGPDDLKKIKGVGPKLEALLHRMGFFHFDQVAAWSADEVAWVDENLEGFKGRVSRDSWVEQAKTLAEGGETEFSQKVDKGDVY
ncbi:MAG: NADH:ubiquinone oxidoreductase [Pseudomonadota bacterium]